MARFDRWSNDTLKGEELARAQRQITDAMRGVIGDALRPTWTKGRGMLPEDQSRTGGEPSERGVPLRVLKQYEAAEKARQEQARGQQEWEEHQRKRHEEFQAAKAAEPWLTWKEFVRRKESKG